jgi:hypothetical protein
MIILTNNTEEILFFFFCCKVFFLYTNKNDLRQINNDENKLFISGIAAC